jgi:predicted phage terminase large subunit-like protein
MTTKEEIRRQIIKAACEEDPLFFTRYFFKHREGMKFITNWHHRLIADTLLEIERGVYDGHVVIINVSPGSSKTQMAVVNWIARSLAINPRCRFLHLSYSDQLAEQNSLGAKDIVESDEYQELWNLKIRPDSKSKKRWNVIFDEDGTERNAGGVYATSMRGQVTGFRAGHMNDGWQGCFVAGSKVNMVKGTKVIDEIKKGDIVLSYNHLTNTVEPKRVVAVQESIKHEIIRFTAGDKEITCTPCHRFFNGESYEEISSIYGKLQQLQGKHLDSMQEVFKGKEKSPQRCEEINREKSDDNILFKGVQQLGCKRIGKIKNFIRKKLSYLFEWVYANKLFNAALFPLMRRLSALKEYARRGQFKLQEYTQRLSSAISEVEAFNKIKGWAVFSVRERGSFGCASYRREQTQQQSEQSCNNVFELSCKNTQIKATQISRYEVVSREPTKVYDIQVEGNNNFFVDGILAHNCIIIDDPLSPEMAESTADRNRINDILVNTIKSRKANPATPILLIMQRLHENDPTGFIRNGGLNLPVKHIKIPAIIKDEETGEDKSYWEYKENFKDLVKQRDEGSSKEKYVFYGQYMQEPAPVGNGEFSKDRIQFFNPNHESFSCREMNIWIFYDPANTKKENADYTAMVVVGLAPDQNYYILDLVRDKLNPTERVNALIKLHKKWNFKGGKPPRVGVEQYGMMTDKYYIQKAQEAINYRFGLEELKGRLSKEDRIRRAIPDWDNSRVYIADKILYNNYKGEVHDLSSEFIEDELMLFPVGKNDDMIDAWTRIYDVEAYFPQEQVEYLAGGETVAKQSSYSNDDFMSW